MKLAVHQPNYLPYLGFFDKARQVDVFVLLDDVQFTTRGYTNRNRIKSPSGSKWLTVPVKRQQDQSIKDVRIDEGKKWQRIHLNTLKHMYGKAPHYQELEDLLQSVYSTDWKFLAKLNTVLIKKVFDFLDINPEIKISSELNIRVNEPTTRIIEICRKVGTSEYLSGISGSKYLDIKELAQEDIKLIYQEFKHPKYSQRFGDFIPNLSIVDYLMNMGSRQFWGSE